jgi:hypothetical protein
VAERPAGREEQTPPPSPLSPEHHRQPLFNHHRDDLTVHLKEEAKEETVKGGAGGGPVGGVERGGQGQVPVEPEEEQEEEEFRDRSEMGSSRTVIGKWSSLLQPICPKKTGRFRIVVSNTYRLVQVLREPCSWFSKRFE